MYNDGATNPAKRNGSNGSDIFLGLHTKSPLSTKFNIQFSIIKPMNGRPKRGTGNEMLVMRNGRHASSVL